MKAIGFEMNNKKIQDKVFAIVHKYKNEYDAGVKDSKSGDEHCDFVERFAQEIIELLIDYGESELIRGYNKKQ